MRYITLELKGYKRLSLNQIETIKLTPENKFHWILGTNGSGKSSLIREITPLAATPSNYHKGGYKKVHVEDKGVEYKLTSDFTGPKNLFSFIRVTNGIEEELNPGHTSTVFNNLVLQVFGITKDIHEFSLGSKEFTRTVRRRKRPSAPETWTPYVLPPGMRWKSAAAQRTTRQSKPCSGRTALSPR
jgi:energy-coupling factor transporter ATP-binding protein EcfA2